MEIKSEKEDFEKLFADMSKGYMTAKVEADRQKAMGRHDYNIFTLFHGFSDEVNLHSNFIASLLDPNGDHYKGDLFLKLFLETCGIDDFGIDTSRATVFKEFKHIDIYISDGKKHIILENKVYAKDQPTQIARYIKAIQNKGAEERDVEDEDICVLYLHPDGKLPDNQSFGDYHAKLLGENPSIEFKVISYGKEILEWIDKCKNEVSNLTDLNVFLSQYKDVIEMIYDRYKRIDEMETAKFVEIFKENYTAASEIANNYQETRKKIIDEFFENVKENLEKDEAIKGTYSIELNSVAYRPIAIKNVKTQDKKWKNFYFTVEFQKSSTYSMPFVGFRRVDENIDAIKFENPFKQLPNQTEYFLAYSDKIFKEDICENIIKDKLNPEDFAGTIKGILEHFEKYNLSQKQNQN